MCNFSLLLLFLHRADFIPVPCMVHSTELTVGMQTEKLTFQNASPVQSAAAPQPELLAVPFFCAVPFTFSDCFFFSLILFPANSKLKCTWLFSPWSWISPKWQGCIGKHIATTCCLFGGGIPASGGLVVNHARHCVSMYPLPVPMYCDTTANKHSTKV